LAAAGRLAILIMIMIVIGSTLTLMNKVCKSGAPPKSSSSERYLKQDNQRYDYNES
jgi:hypothetical protein